MRPNVGSVSSGAFRAECTSLLSGVIGTEKLVGAIGALMRGFIFKLTGEAFAAPVDAFFFVPTLLALVA